MLLKITQGIVVSVAFLFLSSFYIRTEAIGLKFRSRLLENKKYINVEGEVYFKKKGGVLTTHFVKPFENVTVVDANGDMNIYDFKDNTLMRSSSALNSSETSYFWHFLNGNYNDLGLAKTGYVIKTTKQEDGLLVTTWVPKAGFSTPIQSIEMVHEKSLPVYLGFAGARSKPLGKIFFSSYQTVGDVPIPMKITEISYKQKGDSVVTYKVYSDPKINTAVDVTYLDFKIPANAKVVSGK